MRSTPYLWITCLAIFLLQSPFSVIGQVTEPDHPGTRWGHVLVYNVHHDQILLFGGTRKRGTFLDDTWIWKNQAWKKMDVTGPSPRGFCAVVYHEGRNSIILHGGRGNNRQTFSDTWEWDGTQWKQLNTNSDYIADHHQMVYLPDSNRILAFGGWNGKDVSGDTWFWNGEWKKSKTDSPPKRAAFAMAFDKGESKVYLFGGLWINGQYADLWEWQNGQWDAIGGPYDHSSLDHHSMIYDENKEQVVIFGGKNYRFKAQQNTLIINGERIEDFSEKGPFARHSVGLTYNSKTKLGYLYGGKIYKGDEQVALSDFWKWDGVHWSKIE